MMKHLVEPELPPTMKVLKGHWQRCVPSSQLVEAMPVPVNKLPSSYRVSWQAKNEATAELQIWSPPR
jgi:hypothetical protein